MSTADELAAIRTIASRRGRATADDVRALLAAAGSLPGKEWAATVFPALVAQNPQAVAAAQDELLRVRSEQISRNPQAAAGLQMLEEQVESVVENQIPRAAAEGQELLRSARRQVENITLRAALAVALRDWLHPDSFAVLVSPFATVIDFEGGR
jgi:hypothetical protein